MKYNSAKLVTDGVISEVDLQDMREDKIKELLGNLFCPGEDCMATLFISHNSRNGGKTVYLKAMNENHIDTCPYKDENFKAITTRIPIGGFYTEEQINTYVRNLYRDVTTPIEEKKRKKGQVRKKGETTKLTKDKISRVVKSGRIIYGDDKTEGNKGRMSRRYEVTADDKGDMVGVYGYVESITEDKYGLFHIKYKDDRLRNLDILIGSVYKYNNADDFSRMGQLLKYYNEAIAKSQKVYCVCAGLVTEYNNQLTIELQTNHSFVVDGLNITNIVRNNVRD